MAWCHSAALGSGVARHLALFTAVECRVVEEGAAFTVPLGALEVLVPLRPLRWLGVLLPFWQNKKRTVHDINGLFTWQSAWYTTYVLQVPCTQAWNQQWRSLDKNVKHTFKLHSFMYKHWTGAWTKLFKIWFLCKETYKRPTQTKSI